MTNPTLPAVRARSELTAQVKAWKDKGIRVGFVPTMGALHDGHLSLVSTALESCERVVASIFVNPTQFAPHEDFDDYPRTEESDRAKLKAAGADLAYIPSVEEMYPDGSVTNVRVEGLSDMLDGIYRPHFFYGVTTIVARLFLHVQPDVAVFGEKDYQQLQIIRRMVRDLAFPIEVIGGPTIRDADGLAQSSRNAYLSKEQRAAAPAIKQALDAAAEALAKGARVDETLDTACALIQNAGFGSIDYVSAINPSDLSNLPLGPVQTGFEGRLLAAAWLGKTRLIDNIRFFRA